MKRLLINLLEKVMAMLTDTKEGNGVIVHPNLMIAENIRLNEVVRRLPANVGDSIHFESGKAYKVELQEKVLKEIDNKTKCQQVRLRRISKNEEAKSEIVHYQFSCLRELNYYLMEQRHLITEIKKVEFAKPHEYLHLSIDEAHEQALEIEKLCNRMELKRA